MLLPEGITPENAIGTLVAGVAIGFVMVRQYLKDRKSPTTPSGDRIIPGLTIADMQPIRDLAMAQAATAEAVARCAGALEKMLQISQDRAEDAEIVRRAEILAQEMLKKLQATQTRARRRT